MKKLLLILPLLCAAPACKTIDALLDVPGAAAEDVGGVVPGSPTADTAGQVAATGTTLLTGNAALGAGVGALVTILAGMFLKKRKAATA